MTKKQLAILQHALGVDKYGQGPHTRNHFCAGGDDVDACKSLVELGYMWTFERSCLPYYNCSVTNQGKMAMSAESPKPPKWTRSQRRYRAFLKEDSGMTFGEWLRCQKHRREMYA